MKLDFAREPGLTDYSRDYDALIFDCDGTLTDSMPLHFVAWRNTMQRYAIEFTEDAFYAMAGMPSDKIITILASEQGVPVSADQAAHQKEAAFESMIDRLEPKSKVCKVARDHFGKMPMAVASGGVRPIVTRQLRHIGLADLFDVVVTAEDTVRHKPQPDVFLKAAERLNVDPTKCLVFEDSELGFSAADQAGMDWIDVR